MSIFERGFHSEADRAGFSSQEDLRRPTPAERVPVSRRVTFGQLQKTRPPEIELNVRDKSSEAIVQESKLLPYFLSRAFLKRSSWAR
jgi:hypothetical protein